MTAPICKGSEEHNIYGAAGYRRPTHIEGCLYRRDYIYEPQQDGCRCPIGQRPTYRTTNRQGYREYRSGPAICRTCPFLDQCTESVQQVKTATCHVWEDYQEKVDSHRKTKTCKAIYRRGKETVARSFANAKQLHGYRYIRMQGLLRAPRAVFTVHRLS